MDRFFLDRAAVVRGFRQVTWDFNSGNGMDVDGIRHDVTAGAMYIMEAILDFFCSQRRPIWLASPPLQRKMVVCLQDVIDGHKLDLAPRWHRCPSPSSTSPTSARSQAMAGTKRPASDSGLRHGLGSSPKRTRRVSTVSSPPWSDVEPSSSSSSSDQPPPQPPQPPQPVVSQSFPTGRRSDPYHLQPGSSFDAQHPRPGPYVPYRRRHPPQQPPHQPPQQLVLGAKPWLA